MKQRKLWISIVALVLAVLMVGGVLISALTTMAYAASSAALKSQLDDLKSQASEIAAKSSALEQKMAENQSETESIVEKKTNIDQQIDLTRQQAENLNEQIQQYNLLIAAKQDELDEAQAEADRMNEQYKLRIRAMEESGDISYWAILFDASSFTDLLDRIDMISEIAESDQLMIQQMQAVADEIAAAKADIEASRLELEDAKEELAVVEAQLSDQRAEADELIVDLIAKQDEMEATSRQYDALADEVRQEILDTQKAYEDALADEEAARKIAEARRKAQEAAAQGTTVKPSSTGGGSSGGFRYPLASGATITDPYGYRYHPIYGYYRMHTGVDLACGRGTPIYATKSGTVTSASYSEANGYNVSINHNDGFASMYAHMTNYIVSVGQTVSQGEVIGYVGDTGWATGPHLHFELYYGGSTVNPADYVSLG
ncbi:MAG: peptidoglycan DD-metalloendopeptidase family protein [Oscillospiraceae bacterium]|nr:peptidoglycan DD-metalloendopeptidase family protein [Oscillospiraceae bacterium]